MMARLPAIHRPSSILLFLVSVAGPILFGASISPQAGESNAVPATADTASSPVAQDYCANISDKAAEARAAWQTANLQKLAADVTAKVAALDVKQRELQDWIARREQMLKVAGQELVDIYAKMDPEAASAQLVKIDTATAASILRQLSPRGASLILSAMDAERAAKLVKSISAATKNRDAGDGT